MTDWTDDELREARRCAPGGLLAEVAGALLRERATYTARLALAERARDAAIERIAAVEQDRDALSLDAPRAAAIAKAQRRVCEAANEGHDHIVEIGQSDECALCDALAEWRKAKEDA